MSAEYHFALDKAKRLLIRGPDSEVTVIARQFISQHERMHEILAAIRDLINVHTMDDGTGGFTVETCHLTRDAAKVSHDAWAVLRQAVVRKVEP